MKNSGEIDEFTFKWMNDVQQAHRSEKTSKDLAKTLREKRSDMTVKLNDHSHSLNDLTDKIREKENHILYLKIISKIMKMSLTLCIINKRREIWS